MNSKTAELLAERSLKDSPLVWYVWRVYAKWFQMSQNLVLEDVQASVEVDELQMTALANKFLDL